jgi:hypothetical protein
MYLVAAFAFRSGNEGGRLGYLDPIRMTAGMDGKASLGKLQILFFSLIVFGLIMYILFRTGLLTDISSTIRSLLGIAGVGATAAKARIFSAPPLRWRTRPTCCARDGLR